MKPMIKLAKIVESSRYQEYCNATVLREKERIYCHHNMEHFTAVARVAYILYLTKEVSCPELADFSEAAIKEMIYAVGYLHDIGRFAEYDDPAKDHALESAKYSRPLLQEAGFSAAEQKIICKAIEHHRQKNTAGFDRLIYLADKKSRPCHCCPAIEGCKKFAAGERPKPLI